MFTVTALISITTTVACLHLYESDIDLSDKRDHYDCLYYFTDNLLDQYHLIPYCVRPSSNDDRFVPTNHPTEPIMFFQLRQSNVNSRDLYKWSAPIDLIERYQEYLETDGVTRSDNQLFYNCSSLWFGTTCQYTLDSLETFEDIVQERFLLKTDVPLKEVLEITNGTCYTNLICESVQCLDWRNICNGKTDCVNGEDEQHCFELEINICATNEYRCQNGMSCIPQDMFHDMFTPDCLDGTDEYSSISYAICYEEPENKCEERTCRYPTEFPCGDGECLQTLVFNTTSSTDSRTCSNGRDLVFKQTILAWSDKNFDSLTYDCWKFMICALELGIIFDLNCHFICRYDCDVKVLRECPRIFIFPFHPILFSHVRFVYISNRTTSWLDNKSPDYICYDERWCKSYPKTIDINNLACRRYDEFPHLGDTHGSWNSLYNDLHNVFKPCSHPRLMIPFNDSSCPHSSLFHCPNSSQCISKYRLNDRSADCIHGTDENSSNICQLALPYRFKCRNTPDADKCLSPFLVQDGIIDCSDKSDEILDIDCLVPERKCANQFSFSHDQPYAVSFQQICNGFEELIPFHNETDETNCPSEWPCRTQWTECNEFWNCKNGEDEINCPETFHYDSCNMNHQHYCPKPNQYEFDCLSTSLAGDGNIDCLGSTDEKNFCRSEYPNERDRRYRCMNSSKCVTPKQLCNCQYDCPLEDDEKLLCPWLIDYACEERLFTCKDGTYIRSQSRCNNIQNCDEYEDEMLCDLNEIDKPKTKFGFDAATFVSYPSTNGTTVTTSSPANTFVLRDDFDYGDADELWYCNRGILVRSYNNTKICLCPPAYFGSRCQYQSERISVLLKIHRQMSSFEQNVVQTYNYAS
ncbi:unnamed protein product [Didymodactylos carnosus]|uniref:EGF-like domain-containing protein n=1 Tax=Didymodactylos carnosus TaxID=1234261 RepID=A0A815QV71_9BILA|nr:unnamed protein product [Didymodactylos carnosus]CAF1468214.1 unnamed protein product [Didymodactylos carnosus]CAF3955650.1 unnamed protein product [Didymodactylos carnosus]CAF4336796.1 unnamed protein product [Didymodactylos carnosus]